MCDDEKSESDEPRERTLLERLNDAEPGSDEWNKITDDLISQDMQPDWSRSRKKMLKAAQAKKAVEKEQQQQKGE